MSSQSVTNIANAIINKINSLISSHNRDSNAHQDIRTDIPSASKSTPSADTTAGSVGTGTAWARSDHTHPKSSLYAESTHAHSDADITTFGFYTNLPQANYEGPSQQQVNWAINSAMGSKEDNANKVTSLSSSSTDTEYPSAKAVYDAIENTFNLDTLDCINENFTLLSLPQIILTYNEDSIYGIQARLLTRYDEGAYVDWGDGTPIETYEEGDTLEHDYSDNVQEHTIIIYGEINKGILNSASFKDLTGMTSINIPSNVTSLGDSCFYGCTNLTNITIPNSVTSLGKSCLSLCTGLTNITIPSNVTSLGKYCFSGCSNLTNITIPSSVTSLEAYCFGSCARLTSITIPSSVTKLWDHCFYYCTGLTSVTIPSSVTSLGAYCFTGCTNLVDYQLYWETPPVIWSSTLMPNNTDTYFTIPNGTTANYTAKNFPSEKLVERSE